MRAAATLLAAMLGLAACNTAPILDGAMDPLAAPGPNLGASRGGIDPMIVGDRLLDAGEADLALVSYTRAAARDGLTSEVRVAMANANLALGRLQQSEALLRDVLLEEPANARAMNNLGVTLLEQGELGEAHRLFRAAFALQPTPEIQGNLKVSGAQMEGRTYADVNGQDAFTLTARAGGVYVLHAPGQQ